MWHSLAETYPDSGKDGFEEAYGHAKDAVTGMNTQAKQWFDRLNLPEVPSSSSLLLLHALIFSSLIFSSPRVQMKAMLKVVRDKTKRGQRSLHPWFPSDRSRLDQFWSQFNPRTDGYVSLPLTLFDSRMIKSDSHLTLFDSPLQCLHQAVAARAYSAALW